MRRDRLIGAAVAAAVTGAAGTASASYSIYEIFAPAGTPAGVNVRAMAINDRAQILVNGYSNNGLYDFTVFNDFYNGATPVYGLPSPFGAQAHTTIAYGLNNNDQIVGIYHSASISASRPWEGFGMAAVGGHFSGGFTHLINPPGLDYNQPTGINDSGVVVGAAGDLPDLAGYSYNHGTYTYYSYNGGLDITSTPPPSNPTATVLSGINNAGYMIGAFGDGSSYIYPNTFVTNGSSFTLLKPPGWQNVIPGGISNPNAKGDFYVSGGVWDASGHNGAFVYDEAANAYTYFYFPGATYTFASGVNSRGVVVGEWEDASGLVHAFYAVPGAGGVINGSGPPVSLSPEPADWALMLVGVGFAGGRLRRRRASERA